MRLEELKKKKFWGEAVERHNMRYRDDLFPTIYNHNVHIDLLFSLAELLFAASQFDFWRK